MNARLFNACIALGWLMALAGGCLLSVALGLIGAGLLLLVLTLAMARIGGIYLPKSPA